ncbi:MAG TPA: hypothetical protein VK673_21930 [Chthoniobacterales bacterium]|nr:hypothetical protein [Chthoniobacterales bacterium]
MRTFQIKNDGSAEYRAHNEWAKRPEDERFLSLTEMQEHFRLVRSRSRQVVASTHQVKVQPQDADPVNALELVGPNGHGYEPTNWSFGQLATLAGAPAGYLRSLPGPMAADCINYGLRHLRSAEDIGCLLYANGKNELRAATGPNYGRIWNHQVLDALVHYVGDGITGTWKVPGEFGKAITVTRENTTLYASDRDMFIFLADEDNRITVPNRRDGKDGTMAKGIYLWNSEVGSKTFGLGLFAFDFACCNRIVWGMEGYREFKLRHTISAPDRYLEEIRPALQSYANASTRGIEDAIRDAQADKLADVQEFLANRFGPRIVKTISDTHELEEGRPIETRWDVVTAATAYARGIPHQDARVDFEREASKLLVR